MILTCDYPGCDGGPDGQPWEIDTAEVGNTKPSAETRLRMHRSNKHKIAGGGAMEVPELDVSESSTAEVTGPYGGAPAVPTDEVPPASGGDGNRSAGGAPPTGRRGLFDRLKGKAKGAPAEPKATKEKPPKPPRGYPKGGRLSAAATIGDIWGFGGGQLQRVGHVPTGRMARFQAPVAGELLDEIVKGTTLDKVVIQRIVAGRSTIDTLYALFGPLVFTWQLEKALAAGNAQGVEFLEDRLKECIRDGLPIMLPAMKKVRKRERETNAAMADLLDGDDLAAMGVDIVDGKPVDATTGAAVDVADVFVSMLFTDWEAPPAPPPASEEIIDLEPTQ